jgi:hypothetical protein
MFEFLEDNYLLEWWDSEFRAWCAPSFACAFISMLCPQLTPQQYTMLDAQA